LTSWISCFSQSPFKAWETKSWKTASKREKTWISG